MATHPNPTGEDETQPQDKAALSAKAERCRRLAAGISDRQAADVLSNMARNYQDAADRHPEKD